MKQKLLIYGAGAIGRGFIPRVFPPKQYLYYYVEANKTLCTALNKYKQFTNLKTIKGKYEKMIVTVQHCYTPGKETSLINQVDAIITAVGPRNVLAVAENLKGISTPVICCENDSSVPSLISAVTKNTHVFFAIPDVITSNTAPATWLKQDPFTIITEDGVCYIDKRARHLGGNACYLGERDPEQQWQAKLYLHNTPHCIAAYLGSKISAHYLHEAMHHKKIRTIVAGAMQEMKYLLIKKFKIKKAFIDWYAHKELRRFSNTLLYDPISRVAREPFRKLAPNERLIGAAELCLANGIVPKNILLGIMAAFLYDNPKDPDANIRYLIHALQPNEFLTIAMQLKPLSALYELLLARWSYNDKILRSL